MKLTAEEKSSMPIHSLILDRRKAFSELIRAYLRFNVPSAKKVEVMPNGSLSINDNIFKVDISDYTGIEVGFGYILMFEASKEATPKEAPNFISSK